MSLPGPFLLMALAEPIMVACERLGRLPGGGGARCASVRMGSVPGAVQGLLGWPFPVLPSAASCLSPLCAPPPAAHPSLHPAGTCWLLEVTCVCLDTQPGMRHCLFMVAVLWMGHS